MYFSQPAIIDFEGFFKRQFQFQGSPINCAIHKKNHMESMNECALVFESRSVLENLACLHSLCLLTLNLHVLLTVVFAQGYPLACRQNQQTMQTACL